MRTLILTAILAGIGMVGEIRATQVDGGQRAAVLPLALDDRFEFRKVKTYTLTAKAPKDVLDPALAFERKRALYGAVNELDRDDRYGQYLTFFWRIKKSVGELSVRLEYRTAKLGGYVQVQQLRYAQLKAGSFKTEFRVIGDSSVQDGEVTAWRALLIENGRIVALTQSALWQ